MDLTIATALILAALAGAAMLVFQERNRIFPSLAVVAAGAEALLAFKLIQINARGVPLWLLLGAVLAVAGVMCWIRAGAKIATTASTVVVVVGTLQVLVALKVLD